MKIAEFLGFDLSTTALSCGVRSIDGQEEYACLPMMGKTKWHNQPAHDLRFLPDLILAVLKVLQNLGWKFAHKGSLSFSVRQHDLVLLGNDHRPLIPALSWQCNAATREVRKLKKVGVERSVGTIEPRFILPKLIWLLKKEPKLSKKIFKVMTTGDYISWALTGNFFLSTSDALCNGLLEQRSKCLATKAFDLASSCGVKINNSWFPLPLQSGTPICVVNDWFLLTGRDSHRISSWGEVAQFLHGWEVIASLGDNHASAVGCGLSDDSTVVISAGSSGTVVRGCNPRARLAGKAVCFEYYKNRLLLRMLPDCAVWYERFCKKFARGYPLSQLDKLAPKVTPECIRKINQKLVNGKWIEIYPSTWSSDSILAMVASTQFSIATELLLLAKDQLEEVIGDHSITRFVLTGGISCSPFFQKVMAIGLQLLCPGCRCLVSNREGPLANKAAVVGALINAIIGKGSSTLKKAVKQFCPLRPVEQARLEDNPVLTEKLSKILSLS